MTPSFNSQQPTAARGNRMPFFNPRRLRDYPRLIGAAIWCAWGLEVPLHRGRIGGMGWVLWSDFVILCAAGWLDRFSPNQLYDFRAQAWAQQALIAPTPLPGVNPFISPPPTALAYHVLTFLRFPVTLALWNGLTLLWTLHAARRLWSLLLASLNR